jgi:XTP/dITP diphosphohydrolase
MKIVFATSNPHKVKEVRAIVAPLGITVETLDDYPKIPEPDETGVTFEENARQKAIAYAKATGQCCLAEDSGLEVDALGGAPGVHSARYSGVDGSRDERDAANNAKLLAALEGVPPAERGARFVSTLCLCRADGGILIETRGEFPGQVALAPAGSGGFGYDPLLYLPDVDCTSAELSADEKNARSHRGAALRLFAEALERLPGSERDR